VTDPPFGTTQPGFGARLGRRLSKILGGPTVFLLVLAALIGVAGGYGAILFRHLIILVNHLAFPGGIGLGQLSDTPWYWLVLPPAVGGLVVGPLVYFLAREAKGHGVPEVMDACANLGGRIRPHGPGSVARSVQEQAGGSGERPRDALDSP